MTWAKVDDRANENKKQLAAGAEACWLWTCGLMFCGRQRERDGFIPEAAVAMLYPLKSPAKLAAKLVEVGLWERVAGGYQVHDYQQWNPTKEQVEAKKEAAKERASRSYARRREAQKQNSARADEAQSESAETEFCADSNGAALVSTRTCASDSASASDLNPSDPERSSFLSASPKDLTGIQGEPSIQEYCQGLEANRYDASYEPVQKRPEIIAAAAAFWSALKLSPQPLGSYGSDRGVVALCRLYAAGFTQEQLVDACRAAPGDKYFTDPKHRGLSSLTLEVVRRLLAVKQSTPANPAPAIPKRDELSADERRRILESRAQLELANTKRSAATVPIASDRGDPATTTAAIPENGIPGASSRDLGSVVSALAERLG